MKAGIVESKKYVVTPVNQQANLFIGGVATSIPDAASLASKLNILQSDISNFTIVGSDINAQILNNYTLPNNAFRADPNITFFHDYEKCIAAGSGVFYPNGVPMKCRSIYIENALTIGSDFCLEDNAGMIEEVYLPNATTFNGGSHFKACKYLKLIVIPKVTQFGNTAAAEGIFYLTTSVQKIYANPFLATSNGGGEEGDIAEIRSRGCEIIYVQNFTKPNSITNLSIGAVYKTVIELNFTEPTGNTNAISHYEIWVNGFLNNVTDTNEGYAINLNLGTNYSIEVRPVDIYYNKSFSNKVTQTITSGTDATPESNAFISAAGITNSAIQNEVHHFTLYVKAFKIWDRLLGIYPAIGSTFDEIKYNLKSPTQYTLTAISAPTVGANTWTGGNMGTGIFPQDLEDQNYHLSFFSKTDTSGTYQMIGSVVSGTSMIRHLVSGRNFLNDAYADRGKGRLISGLPQTTGLITMERANINIQRNYRNGLLIGEDRDGNEGTKPTYQFTISGGIITGCFAAIGNHLTYRQNRELNNLVVRLNNVLGR